MSTAIQSGVAEGSNEQAAAAPRPPVIELQNLCVRFGKREILKQPRLYPGWPRHRIAGTERRRQIDSHQHSPGLLQAMLRLGAGLGYDIRSETRRIRSLVGYMPENDAFISKMRRGLLRADDGGTFWPAHRRRALERAHEALFCVGPGRRRDIANSGLIRWA